LSLVSLREIKTNTQMKLKRSARFSQLDCNTLTALDPFRVPIARLQLTNRRRDSGIVFKAQNHIYGLEFRALSDQTRIERPKDDHIG
jgi:hypothetical protein